MNDKRVCPYCKAIQSYTLKENDKVICNKCRKELPKENTNKWKQYNTTGAK